MCVPPTCCLCVIGQADYYFQNLHQTRFGQPRDVGSSSTGRMGGPAPNSAQSQSGVNGQGPSSSYSTNPPTMNGVQPPPPVGAIPGMSNTANPTLHNPTLQHLQQRMPGYPPPTGPGMPMQQPIYVQQRGPGAPMGPMGPMAQMQSRTPNGAPYPPNPNYRPPPNQQSPQQTQDMQGAGASGSPKQPGAPSTTQNSSPHLQDAMRANGNTYEVIDS